MSEPSESAPILGIFPHSKGLGYALFANPKEVIDSGCCSARPRQHKEKALDKLKKYLDYYRPSALVLRDISEQHNITSNHTRALIQGMCKVAKSRDIDVHFISRQQIREVFEQFGASSKFEIAKRIVELLPEYKHKMPRLRKLWMSEDHRMPMFDALSLVYAHFYLKE